MVGMVLERGIDGINGQLPGGNNKDKLRRVVTAVRVALITHVSTVLAVCF